MSESMPNERQQTQETRMREAKLTPEDEVSWELHRYRFDSGTLALFFAEGISDDEFESRRALMQEAGTVYHETGLTPRQLAEQVSELRAALGPLQHVICSWCGFKAYREGRTDAELSDVVNEHVMACEKRPEAKALTVIYALSVALGLDLDSVPKESGSEGLIAAFDARWQKISDEREALAEQRAALLKLLGRIVAAYSRSGRICESHHGMALRFPVCAACQVEARIEEAAPVLAEIVANAKAEGRSE